MKKRAFFVLLLITISMIAYSEYLVLDIEIPGLLKHEIVKRLPASTNVFMIDSLKINGRINGSDIAYLRYLTNALDPSGDYDADDPTKTKLYAEWGLSGAGTLEYLDLTDATIVEGGDSYGQISTYGKPTYSLYTKNNTVGTFMLDGTSLRELILPKNITEVETYGLGWTPELRKLTFHDGIKKFQGVVLQPTGSMRHTVKIKLPNTLEEISPKAFYQVKDRVYPHYYEAPNLTLSIPDRTWCIGDSAFLSNYLNLDNQNLHDVLSRMSYIGYDAIDILRDYNYMPPETLSIPSLIYLGRCGFVLANKTVDLTFSRDRISGIPQDQLPFQKEKPFFIGGTTDYINENRHGPETLNLNILHPEIDGDTIVIGESAFKNSLLKTINITTGLKIVASDESFMNCDKLGNLRFLRLNTSAVKGCTGLKSLSFEKSDFNENIDDASDNLSTCYNLEVFLGPNIKDIANGAGTKDGLLFYTANGVTRLVKFPGGKTEIVYAKDFENAASKAFANCYGTKRFHLESGSFPGKIMENFANLESITVNPESDYVEIGNLIYEKGGKDGEIGALVCYPEYAMTSESITITGGWREYAYYGKYPTLEKVVIPKSLGNVSGLFPNATNISMIVCESETPPQIDWTAFHKVRWSQGLVVLVPKGAYANYKTNDDWKRFNIVENDGVEDIEGNMVKIATNGQTLMVSGAAEGARLEVYSTDGRTIYNGTESCIELPQPGLYIMRIGSLVKKIIVK